MDIKQQWIREVIDVRKEPVDEPRHWLQKLPDICEKLLITATFSGELQSLQ